MNCVKTLSIFNMDTQDWPDSEDEPNPKALEIDPGEWPEREELDRIFEAMEPPAAGTIKRASICFDIERLQTFVDSRPPGGTFEISLPPKEERDRRRRAQEKAEAEKNHE